MAGMSTFNSTVAARTRTAEYVLNTPAVLELFQQKGGLESDLIRVKTHGVAAAMGAGLRKLVSASGESATQKIQEEFEAVQRDYLGIMDVAVAVAGDLKLEKADGETLKKLEAIVRNEAQVTIVTEGEGSEKKRKAVRSESREALRAEIERDARALVALTAAHPYFAKRRCEASRFEKLAEAAAKLAGYFAERAAKKGTAKAATSDVRKEVALQKEAWGITYRILAAVGREDAKVRSLLQDASR